MQVSTLRELMSPAPHVIDAKEDTAAAHAMMLRHGVRHLPVVSDGELFGVLSERDIEGARAVLRSARGELGPPVSALCGRPPFVVQADQGLDEVAIEMANRRLGAALVTEATQLVGIVTTVDLLRELARIVGRIRSTGGAA